MGSAIDVSFNFSGGHCRTHRHYPQGPHHRRPLQLWWWPLPDPSAAPPRGLPSTSCYRWELLLVSFANASQGATGKYYHSEQDVYIVAKKILDPCDAKDSKNELEMKNHHQQKRSGGLFTCKRSYSYKVGIPTCLWADARTTQLRPSRHPRCQRRRHPRVPQRALAPPAPKRPRGPSFGSTSACAWPPPVPGLDPLCPVGR
jgi:hypothetical protein